MSREVSLSLLFLGWLASFLGAAAAPTASPDTVERLRTPGHVLLIRHTHAPGVGDPAGMDLADCTTQRNLDDRGRQQARALGDELRTAKLGPARVYTSQWCRCRETATLLALGPVEDLPALNSFFENPEARNASIRALREFLDQLPRDGGVVVLVTHQVNITALTGYFPASGAGVVLQLRNGGGFERVAEFGQFD